MIITSTYRQLPGGTPQAPPTFQPASDASIAVADAFVAGQDRFGAEDMAKLVFGMGGLLLGGAGGTVAGSMVAVSKNYGFLAGLGTAAACGIGGAVVGAAIGAAGVKVTTG